VETDSIADGTEAFQGRTPRTRQAAAGQVDQGERRQDSRPLRMCQWSCHEDKQSARDWRVESRGLRGRSLRCDWVTVDSTLMGCKK
jgi:hypothetical protein